MNHMGCRWVCGLNHVMGRARCSANYWAASISGPNRCGPSKRGDFKQPSSYPTINLTTLPAPTAIHELISLSHPPPPVKFVFDPRGLHRSVHSCSTKPPTPAAAAHPAAIMRSNCRHFAWKSGWPIGLPFPVIILDNLDHTSRICYETDENVSEESENESNDGVDELLDDVFPMDDLLEDINLLREDIADEIVENVDVHDSDANKDDFIDDDIDNSDYSMEDYGSELNLDDSETENHNKDNEIVDSDDDDDDWQPARPEPPRTQPPTHSYEVSGHQFAAGAEVFGHQFAADIQIKEPI
ncbi:hypothetical protein E3N88_11953 [Mikania micrantha]|uniref:Uncharacterized protein n=1 Tax=Mikania micrantha TaxID=192012 RepID=A0A5N6P448_9ASTR|nr:hypothetical protein E3N88_11953 [Mikania micrantha]